MGASIDRSVNNGGGPPVFKISGQVCHRIGSLLPGAGDQPKFAQLYIYDTSNELANRLEAIQSGGTKDDDVCPEIAAGLLHMLDEFNPLVKQFRIARDRLQDHGNEEIGIRIVGAAEGDPVQYELPTASELAGLIIGDFSKENYKRDIIVHATNGALHRVPCLHPAYMPLQYPLLFPYGERGYQLGIRYQGAELFDENCRAKVTMLDYYCYRCHYKTDEPNPFLCYGKLSEQAKVDGYACVEESRLKYINDHQDDFRCEYFQGIVDAVGKGTLDAASIGKKKFLPASFTGGRRYMTQNYQDALAICRVHGCPDWFTTFTCNPKWIEFIESLESEPGQQPADRSDFIVRVYNMKLEEMMGDIKDGTAFGPIVAVLQSTEFQKRGLPHAHILVWVKKDGREGIDIWYNNIRQASAQITWKLFWVEDSKKCIWSFQKERRPCPLLVIAHRQPSTDATNQDLSNETQFMILPPDESVKNIAKEILLQKMTFQMSMTEFALDVWKPQNMSVVERLHEKVSVTVNQIPAHLCTSKIVGFILSPYCAMDNTNPAGQTMTTSEVFTCSAWTDSALKIPERIMAALFVRPPDAEQMEEGYESTDLRITQLIVDTTTVGGHQMN